MEATTPINSLTPVNTVKANTPVKTAQVSTHAANVSFSGGVKAPKGTLRAVGKALRSVVKWTIAAVILAYRAGKGLCKFVGNVAKNIFNFLSKFTKSFVKNADKIV